MNTTQKTRTLLDVLPEWVKRVEYCTFHITTMEPNDTYVEKAVIESNGCKFEVLCYDKEYSELIVFVRNHYPQTIKAGKFEDFIRERS